MKAAQLTPPQRRLLKLAARVEPREVAISPGERQARDELVELGLLRETTLYGSMEAVCITDAGREAVNG